MAQTLQPGWTTDDVGSVAAAGATTFGAETLSVRSTGLGVGGTSDRFTLVYRRITGDTVVIARLTSLQNTDAESQAGVMIRESLASGSRHAFLFGTPTQGLAVRVRKSLKGSTAHTAGAQRAAPVWLKLQRRSSTLIASWSPDGVTWTVIRSTKVRLGSSVLVGLAVASHASSSVSASFSDVMVIGHGTLDGGYAARDVGAPTLTGGSWSDGSTVIVDSVSAGIKGRTDQFRFVYRRLSGAQELIARVSGLQLTHESSRAGLMIRAGLMGTSANAALTVAPKAGITFTRRAKTGVDTVITTQIPAGVPVWLKLSRQGGMVTAAYSNDGTTWIAAGQQTLDLPDSVYVGVGLTSGTSTARARATFDGVRVGKNVASANVAPAVSLAAPASSLSPPAFFTLQATATDVDGAIARVAFYVGTSLLGSDASSPYTFAWANVPLGTHTLTAVATDDKGATTTSAARILTVARNTAPVVTLTVPASNASFTAPASITLAATAADVDGVVSVVEFYDGTRLLGSDTSSPYSFQWSNVAAGSYSLTAVARDTQGGMTVSSARDMTVVAGGTPSKAIFSPASIHNALDRYVLEIFRAGSNPAVAAPVATQDLGVPTVVNGECTANVGHTVAALPAGNYIATVTAQSVEHGTFRSAASPPFTR